jgi:hypothetical protein
MFRFPINRLTMVVFTLLILLSMAGCNLLFTSGSGNVVEREFQFTDFDQVEVGNAFRGTINYGDDYRVSVRVDDNLEQYLQVEKAGDRLIIALEPQIATSRSTLEFEIVMPSLNAVRASGATVAELSGFAASDDLTIDASGASRVEGDAQAGALAATASGASTIRLTGSGEDLTADASGASTIDLDRFAVDNANVNASGASRINVNAAGRLDAQADGASSVRYSGNPTLGNIQESGGSTVRSQ